MSRIRTVKPDFFRHLALFEAEEKYRLPLRVAYAGLFTCCDRQGRFLWQPRRLKVDILPYDEADMVEVLNALLENGFIKAYEVRGIIYGCIPTWAKHQYFNNKEPDSVLPTIDEGKILTPPIQQSALAIHAQFSEEAFVRSMSENNTCGTSEQRELPEATLSELSHIVSMEDSAAASPLSSSIGSKPVMGTRTQLVKNACFTREPLNGRERNGKEDNKSGVIKNSKHCPIAKEDVFKIFSHWQQVMGHSQAKLDASRDKWIRGALRMGYSVEDCFQAITGCSQTQYNMRQNERGERYDGFHIIFKSADQIDRFIQNALFPPRPVGKSEQRLQNNTHAAEAWLKTQPLPGEA